MAETVVPPTVQWTTVGLGGDDAAMAPETEGWTASNRSPGSALRRRFARTELADAIVVPLLLVGGIVFLTGISLVIAVPWVVLGALVTGAWSLVLVIAAVSALVGAVVASRRALSPQARAAARVGVGLLSATIAALVVHPQGHDLLVTAAGQIWTSAQFAPEYCRPGSC